MSNEIPKVFHQFWMGGPVPSWADRLRRRMLAINPGWESRVWTDETLHAEFGMFNRKEFLDVKGLAYKSDVARYEIIARFGGVYCDFDIIWLRPLESFVNLGFDFVARENRISLNNGIFGCRRGSPFAWDLVGDLPEEYAAQRDLGGRVWQTGVGYFGKVAAKHAPHLVRLPPVVFHPYTVKDFRSSSLFSHPTAAGIHFFNSNGFESKVESWLDSSGI